MFRPTARQGQAEWREKFFQKRLDRADKASLASIPSPTSTFFEDGVDANGNPNRHWYTNTVGNPPQMGGTTVINAPLQPVNVELDDVNGNLVVIGGHPMISLATPFVAPVLGSPVFSNSLYSSGDTPTQFSDAIQRAEFYNHPMKPDWHTLLNPQPAALLTIHFSQAATCTGETGKRTSRELTIEMHDCGPGVLDKVTNVRLSRS